jgi:hypothetical protein
VSEGQLELSGSAQIAMKGDEPAQPPPIARLSSPPKGKWVLQIAAGVATGPVTVVGSPAADGRPPTTSTTLERSFAAGGGLTYGVTDRLTWAAPFPAFSYRFGEDGDLELLVRGGLTSLGYSPLEGIIGTADAGVALRTWMAPTLSLVATASAYTWMQVPVSSDNTAGTRLSGGYTSMGLAWDAARAVTFHVGTSFAGVLGDNHPSSSAFAGGQLSVGSVQALGYHSLPLVQIFLSRRFSLDGHASWSVDLHRGGLSDRYMAGFTAAF